MASVFAQFAFAQVLFVASVVAIALQCLVYPIRHRFGVTVATRVLRGSLAAFGLVAVGSVLAARLSGSLASALDRVGWTPVADFALLVGLTMFVSYFMGARYLADERERSTLSPERGASVSGTDTDRQGV